MVRREDYLHEQHMIYFFVQMFLNTIGIMSTCQTGTEKIITILLVLFDQKRKSFADVFIQIGVSISSLLALPRSNDTVRHTAVIVGSETRIVTPLK